MLFILPPSETKRDGGEEGSRLDLSLLSYGELNPQRLATLSALSLLARNSAVATGALSLGPTQRHELARNRAVATSAVMPALARYTGVLFDGLDAQTLTPVQRTFASRHVVIHSALLGLLGADDRIPAYRLSHNSRLPGLSLRRHWRDAVSHTLATHDGVILDLRSEAYASLGPAPRRSNSVYLRVVSHSGTGRRVALSHFNKKAKGQFTRAVIDAGIVHESVDSLVDWARSVGLQVEPGAPGELDLVV